MSKASIKEIVFNVRGKELKLSSDEAKELKGILNDLFGETKVVHEHEYVPYYPWRPWSGTYWSSGITYTANGLGNSGNATLTSYALPDGASQNTGMNDTLYLSIK